MGAVLAVEAAISIAEAVEAATATAEAAEAITSGVEAGEVIDAGVAAGEETGAEAGSEASAAGAEGGEALSKILTKLRRAVEKIAKMVDEFIVIDAGFKAAKAILQALTRDPTALARAKKLGKLIDVLCKCTSIIKSLSDWLKKNGEDTTNLDDITVTMQGVLSKFLPGLASVSLLESRSVYT